MGLAILTNGQPGGQMFREALANAFFDCLFHGKPTRNRWQEMTDFVESHRSTPASPDPDALPPAPVEASPSLELTAYTGLYRNNYWGDLTVVASGSNLVAGFGRLSRTISLVPYDGHTFQDPESNKGAFFTVVNGTATRVDLKPLGFAGRDGVFNRIP